MKLGGFILLSIVSNVDSNLVDLNASILSWLEFFPFFVIWTWQTKIGKWEEPKMEPNREQSGLGWFGFRSICSVWFWVQNPGTKPPWFGYRSTLNPTQPMKTPTTKDPLSLAPRLAGWWFSRTSVFYSFLFWKSLFPVWIMRNVHLVNS